MTGADEPSPILLDRKDGVLLITLNRPPANAINLSLSHAVAAALATLQSDEELFAGIITANGDRIFSAGWDLKEASREETSSSTDWGPGGFAGITEFFDLKKPVIAAVNGAAVGGGFEIALACDVIVASDNAFFALPEMAICTLPIAGGLQRLPRKVPQNIAFEMLLTGRRMTAEEGARWGLINRVVRRDRLLEEAQALARSFANHSPVAIHALKEALRAMDGRSIEDAFHVAAANRLPHRKRMLASPDRLEGPRAFSEKRKPVWQSR